MIKMQEQPSWGTSDCTVNIYNYNGVDITLYSDIGEAGELLDTDVHIAGQYLITIAGSDITNLMNELEMILNKYRI